MNDNIFESEMAEMPIIPPRITIAFRCKDCDCIWTFGIETAISFQRFYEKNKECPKCDKANIEIDIITVIPIQPQE